MPPNIRSTDRAIKPFPIRGYAFLTLCFVCASILITSIVVYGLDRRLGYSHAIHSAIFFTKSGVSGTVLFASVAFAAGLTYVIYRLTNRRYRRGLKLVPTLVQIALVLGAVIYTVQVLQIDIRFTPVEERAK